MLVIIPLLCGQSIVTLHRWKLPSSLLRTTTVAPKLSCPLRRGNKMAVDIQPVYDEINRVIKRLGKQEAIDILDEISSHCETMSEALQQEVKEEED